MLKIHGFINYYGLQRFGSSVVSPTYVVGKSLACGNCEEVYIINIAYYKSQLMRFSLDGAQIVVKLLLNI